MKSTLPKAQTLSFTEFQSFFNMERFIDRGIPIIITFNKEDEYDVLLRIKNIIYGSLFKQGTNECKFGPRFYTKDISNDVFQSNLSESTKEATNILMSESLFTMCLRDFVTPLKNARKNLIMDKSPCQQIINFTSSKVFIDNTSCTIPLSMTALFSMQISVIIESGDDNNDVIVWESARSKAFAERYISHNIHIGDFCSTFKSKNVYSFVQNPREIVIFPPSCAKQGRAEGNVKLLTMWSVHNIISLSLNNIIKDFSPTKSLDKRAAVKQSIKHFLVAAMQRQPYQIQNEFKVFDYFIEALLLLENMCDLIDTNFGVHLCSFEEIVPKVYASGVPYSACSICCESTYGTAFFRKQAGRNDCFCINCLDKVADELDDIIEVVFVDPEDHACSINDRELLCEFYNSLLFKFSFDPQLMEILHILNQILPPFSDTFYLNRGAQQQSLFKSTENKFKGMWCCWEAYFKEKICTNEKINKLLQSKEDSYKYCIPTQRFHKSPIMFGLLIVHSFQKSEIEILIEELHSIEAVSSQPCMYTLFILKLVESNAFRFFRTREKEVIKMKLMESNKTHKNDIIYSQCDSAIILDKEKISGAYVFNENTSIHDKKRTISKIVAMGDKGEPFNVFPAKEYRKRKQPFTHVTFEFPDKRSTFEIPSRVFVAISECNEDWLSNYLTTKVYFGKAAFSKIGEDINTYEGAGIVTEKYVVNNHFTIHLNSFFIENNKRNNMFFSKYKENISFLSKIRLILSKVLTNITSFSVSLTEVKDIKVSGTKHQNIVKLFKNSLLEEYYKCTTQYDMQNVEEFSLDLFYKLLITTNSKTQRPLILDIISDKNKKEYGWMRFDDIEFSTFPYSRGTTDDIVLSFNVFGINYM